MTAAEALTMPPGREFDAAVAEHVHQGKFDGDTLTDGRRCWPIPNYSADPAADLASHRVACGWIFSKRMRYFQLLDELIQSRCRKIGLRPGESVTWPHALAFYELGDYSRAALAVVVGA